MKKDDKSRLVTIGDMELLFAKFFGQLVTHFDLDRRFDEKASKDQVEKLQNTLDGFAGRIDEDDTERAAMNNQLDRHGRWIGELSSSTRTQLSAP